MRNRLVQLIAVATAVAIVAGDIPRTSEGRPDLSGVYDIATLTPLERPEIFGDNQFLSADDAKRIEARTAAFLAATSKASDPNREAPPAGGDGSGGPYGNVGGYNTFWLDPGDNRFAIDGKFRTSIIHEPKNGQMPTLTPRGAANRVLFATALFRKNEGKAWWLEDELDIGPYDDPELRPLGERCLLGFGSTSGPPMLPTLYNNVKRIVQTPDHVMILVEMVHDARIIRLNSEHVPPDVLKWTGDSIGHWEDDTLVVDTTNFRSKSGLYIYGATENLHVVERFKRVDKDTLMYSFTVEDPAAWEEPWSGEYPWPATDTNVYEYACHEANYALGNVMRGARLLEADIEQSGASGE